MVFEIETSVRLWLWLRLRLRKCIFVCHNHMVVVVVVVAVIINRRRQQLLSLSGSQRIMRSHLALGLSQGLRPIMAALVVCGYATYLAPFCGSPPTSTPTPLPPAHNFQFANCSSKLYSCFFLLLTFYFNLRSLDSWSSLSLACPVYR